MKPDTLILIVDDNAATRYAMRRVLDRHGYAVLEAATGAEGTALIKDSPVDAVILDVNLPDASGFDIVRGLRGNPETALLPVIHVSAASIATGDLITGLDAGADAYLIHPVDPDVLVATLRTILRVRDTESALRESQERFREIFTTVAAPIALMDASLKLHQSNRAFEHFMGDAISSGHLKNGFVKDQDETLDALSSALSQRKRWQGTLNILIDGVLRYTDWRIVPHQEPDIGIAFVEDITAHRLRDRFQSEQLDSTQSRLAEEVAEREKAQALLVQSQKMDALGKLTGGIAHDFNNLLTSIITGTEMLHAKIESHEYDRVDRFVDLVLSSAHRAAGLTHRLLAFARQQTLDAQAVDVNKCVSSLQDLLLRTIGEQTELVITLPDAPLVAMVDANQLENAILNLVINARDAMARKGIISIEVSDEVYSEDTELMDGRYVVVTVRDNGPGIPPDILEKVFEPFFTTKPAGQGTGLGLSMIYGFARQSKGDARIDSIVGVGTAVHVILPKVSGYATTTKTSVPTSLGHGEKILLVEDMETVRALVLEVLVATGYRCDQAANGKVALAMLEAPNDYKLLLTDVGLPGMRGPELAERARKINPNLPILFMTGYDENSTSGKRFTGPNVEIITKPFEMRRLLAAVRKIIQT